MYEVEIVSPKVNQITPNRNLNTPKVTKITFGLSAKGVVFPVNDSPQGR
jgi:hypothetical protein